ncbi:MAG: FMN adenylyltransferase [Candidatus Daviesbacteria bacterium GW2011_GWA2_42_7]|uniref:riboflavin kinase n=1 Tax=Candidatus Daviesbacteria bacterium GW2011_GWA2_42_7 TaxID=1618425 RepID=A0A0G1B7V2_9BACT|nr:MAG: FMN adenylyltransferase [Candidatus Daviesbacteria bacterium GW2011_GWA2_42_7]
MTLRGRVVPFDGRGRSLGYPTANIKSKTNLTNGIYFGFADLNGYRKHPAIIFIGTPTTVGDSSRRVEAYLLDVDDKDYYELDISLDIKKFHRPSKTFNSIEELKATMKNDEIAAHKWFNRPGK